MLPNFFYFQHSLIIYNYLLIIFFGLTPIRLKTLQGQEAFLMLLSILKIYIRA